MPQEIKTINASPRYHHKTTRLVEWMDENDDPTLFIADQHQLADEVCYEHLGPGEYGIDADNVVWVQGRERACPNCTHEITGNNYYKVEKAAKNALDRHRVVKPEVFGGEICPYAATKYAAKHADWVVTVPEMIDRLDITFDDWNIVIDEESTQKKFFPKETKMFEVVRTTSDLVPYETHISDDLLDGDNGLEEIVNKVQDKIDSLDRVPSRYKNIVNGIKGLIQLHNRIRENVDLSDPEATIETIENVDMPDVELQGTEREITKTFEYLRKSYGRYKAEPAIEAMLSDPKLHAQKSQSRWNIYLIPNPEKDVLIQKKAFENSKRLGLVGSLVAYNFLGRLVDDPEDYINPTGEKVHTDNLDIAVIEGNEMQRRGMMTKVSKRLADSGMHNLLISGSGTRAAQAHEKISPKSYLFRGDATLDEYRVPAEGNWSVVSYMGSRLTRGIDVDTNVTIVRSSQFAAPRWHYHEDDPTYEAIRNYENLIETHNAMLRGAGQGEQHISIVPAISSLFFGLEQYVTSFELDEIDKLIEFVLSKFDIVPDNLWCEECGRRFLTDVGYREHDCEENLRADELTSRA